MDDPGDAHPDDTALAADPGRWPAPAGPLVAADRPVSEHLHQADQTAIRHQRQHQALTVAAAVCEAAAVLVAIGQLAYPVHGPWLPAAEAAAAMAAPTVVGLGLVAARRTW
ncbi:MAG: hypothetical protein J2P46_06310 [Zavarzinella sp.]|nr:hypothetical protein [Zavarzinella sp.]